MLNIASSQWTRAHGTLLLAVSLEPKEIGQRIAAARVRKGWTQLSFALEAAVSPSTVTRWESGKLPPVRELVRIAGLLGVEPEALVETALPADEDARLARLEEAAENMTETLEGMERGIEQILAQLNAQADRTTG